MLCRPLSFRDSSIGQAIEYAERAEYMYIAPGQATMTALLALFWLKVAELEGKAVPPLESVAEDPPQVDRARPTDQHAGPTQTDYVRRTFAAHRRGHAESVFERLPRRASVGKCGCVGQDLNLRTPAGQRPQRCAFDQAGPPTHGAL